MTYSIGEKGPCWAGKPIKGVDAASFAVLSTRLARDRDRIFMLGRPADVDAATFEQLSPSHVRDQSAVFYVMETKLKPVTGADPQTFRSLGGQFGRDTDQAFVRDKRLRISKAGSLDALTSFGHVYAHDGAVLFFTTKQFQPPSKADIDWSRIGLKWAYEDGYDINIPPLFFFDGAETWYAREFPSAKNWIHLVGADFATIGIVPGHDNEGTYLRDSRCVWYSDGEFVDGAEPSEAEMHGRETLRQGSRLWAGAKLLDIEANKASFIAYHHNGPPDYFNGDLFHLGDRLIIADPEKGSKEIARAIPDPLPLREIACLALRPLLGRLFTILETFMPVVDTPSDIAERFEPDPDRRPKTAAIKLVEPPEYELDIDASGLVELRLSSGAVVRQPASAWYTLGCLLWCDVHRIEPELVPFSSTTSMLPSGTELSDFLMRKEQVALTRLASALFRSGFETDARVLAHRVFQLTYYAVFSHPGSLPLSEVANAPQPLAEDFQFKAPHYAFTSTTNLAVARHIVKERWLEAPDFRDRLDVLKVLYGTMIGTGQCGHFLGEIIPVVMRRYEVEPLPHLKEQLAFVLEAACIAAQVDAETERRYHYDKLLPVIDFCIRNGIRTRYNKARRVEALWALDRTEEGNREADELLAQYGDNIAWSGIYCGRLAYRTTRLWLLAARLRICLRPAGHPSKSAAIDTHRKRLEPISSEWVALQEAYGKEVRKWAEGKDVARALQDYETAFSAEKSG